MDQCPAILSPQSSAIEQLQASLLQGLPGCRQRSPVYAKADGNGLLPGVMGEDVASLEFPQRIFERLDSEPVTTAFKYLE
jgi:hypothetical protein